MGDACVCAMLLGPVRHSQLACGRVDAKLHEARKGTPKNFGTKPFWGVMLSRLIALLSGACRNWDHTQGQSGT